MEFSASLGYGGPEQAKGAKEGLGAWVLGLRLRGVVLTSSWGGGGGRWFVSLACHGRGRQLALWPVDA